MGTEWGLGPFTIEQTTEDVTAIHRLAASRPPRATALSRPAAGARAPSGDPREGRATAHDPSRTSDQNGPEPGHLRRRRARSERRPTRVLGRRATGTKAPARSAVIREGSPEADGRMRV
jgi:hypothetical protein